MDTQQKNYLESCRTRVQADLVTGILPFWLEYGLDPVHGGVYTCLDRDGTVAQPAKGNLFKGPFHIPRMMLKTAELYTEILEA